MVLVTRIYAQLVQVQLNIVPHVILQSTELVHLQVVFALATHTTFRIQKNFVSPAIILARHVPMPTHVIRANLIPQPIENQLLQQMGSVRVNLVIKMTVLE